MKNLIVIILFSWNDGYCQPISNFQTFLLKDSIIQSLGVKEVAQKIVIDSGLITGLVYQAFFDKEGRPKYQISYKLLPIVDTFETNELYYDKEKWQSKQHKVIYPKTNTFATKYQTLVENFGFDFYYIDSAINYKIIIDNYYRRERDSIIVESECLYQNLKSAKLVNKYKMPKTETGLIDWPFYDYIGLTQDNPISKRDFILIPTIEIDKDSLLLKKTKKQNQRYSIEDYYIKRNKKWYSTIIRDVKKRILKVDYDFEQRNYYYHDSLLSSRVKTNNKNEVLEILHNQYEMNNKSFSIQTLENKGYFFYYFYEYFSNKKLKTIKTYLVNKEEFKLLLIEEFSEKGLLIQEIFLNDFAKIHQKYGGKNRKNIKLNYEYNYY